MAENNTAEEISGSVDSAVAVRTRGVPIAVVVGAFSVENRVVIVLRSVHPEQIALFENTGSESLFLCAEINAVYSEICPCGSYAAHNGKRVDLRTRCAGIDCRLVKHMPYKACTVQSWCAGRVVIPVCACAVAVGISVVVADITGAEIIIRVRTVGVVVIHPFHIGIVINSERLKKGSVARNGTAAVVRAVPARGVRLYGTDISSCKENRNQSNCRKKKRKTSFRVFFHFCTASKIFSFLFYHKFFLLTTLICDYFDKAASFIVISDTHLGYLYTYSSIIIQ